MSKRRNNRDFIQVMIKPFLILGFTVVLAFGTVYYLLYALIMKLTKQENAYGNFNGFVQYLKAIVFSSTIKKHTDVYRNRTKVKKSRKQSAEYISRPKGRLYVSSREEAHKVFASETEDEKSKNHFFKRFFAYASIFFLREDIRKEKAKEIDQKYPPVKKKTEDFKASIKSYEKTESQPSAIKQSAAEIVSVETEQIESPMKRSPLQRRIMIGSLSVIVACALVFVGALAYAQELPDNLNFISPKPTADLFRTTVPVPEDEVCPVDSDPDSEAGLYMQYPDTTEESKLTITESSEEVTVITDTVDNNQNIISGNITTQPKIFRQGDEDPEVAKIQTRLMELHYMKSDDVTEYYGKNTTYAMEYFQRQHGLQVDGTTGAETLEALYSQNAQEYKVDEGTEGSDVKEIQQRLYNLKYLSSSSYVTGYFGSKTKAAVKEFQSVNGLSSDGVVGHYTYTKLFSSSAKKKPTSSSGGGGSSDDGGATGSGSADDIVRVAKSLMNQGYVYVWGGKSPSAGGFDCSGFVYYVLNQAGIKTGYRDTSAWATTTSFTTIEKMEDVKPGDVLVFSSGHVAIYIGGGKMIHSTSKGDDDPGGIYIDNFFTSYREKVWVWGKRIVG